MSSNNKMVAVKDNLVLDIVGTLWKDEYYAQMILWKDKQNIAEHYSKSE